MNYLQIVAVTVAVLVLIYGIRLLVIKAWDDFMRPGFRFDEEQARSDVEELIANDNKPPSKRAF